MLTGRVGRDKFKVPTLFRKVRERRVGQPGVFLNGRIGYFFGRDSGGTRPDRR